MTTFTHGGNRLNTCGLSTFRLTTTALLGLLLGGLLAFGLLSVIGGCSEPVGSSKTTTKTTIETPTEKTVITEKNTKETKIVK